MNNLTGRLRRAPRHCAVSAHAIASQLIRNGRYEDIDRESSRPVSQEVLDLSRVTPKSPVNISENFPPQEFAASLKHLKSRKAPGPDSTCSELITHAGAASKFWLCDYFSSRLRHLKVPKVRSRALVVAIPKPKKPAEDPKSYRPFSLLCVPYKILHASVEPIVDPLLSREQAGFRQGRSTVDQIVLPTQNIEDSFNTTITRICNYLELPSASVNTRVIL